MPKAKRRSSVVRPAPYPSPLSRRSSSGSKGSKGSKDAKSPETSETPKTSKTSKSFRGSKDAEPSRFPDTTDFDPSSIPLDGEDSHSVPVYDTCAEIRSKITSLLDSSAETEVNGKKKKYNKTVLCQQMGDGMRTQTLQRFRDHEGEMGGAETKAYYLGYIFFEKLRIHSEEEKSASRKKAEKKFGDKGRELYDPDKNRGGGRRGIFVGPGEDPNDFLTAEEVAQGWYFPKGKVF
ncbi:hypothetical protein MMC08_002483 [Hypocenomyce scalaris]|nr:hypothetical protein [Hypocenomyce scalaris]